MPDPIDNDEAEAQFLQGVTLLAKNTNAAASQAVSHLQRAANADHAEAQFRLGQLYEEGMGVKHDPISALHLYRKAAANGHERAARRVRILDPDSVRVESDVVYAADDRVMVVQNQGNSHRARNVAIGALLLIALAWVALHF